MNNTMQFTHFNHLHRKFLSIWVIGSFWGQVRTISTIGIGKNLSIGGHDLYVIGALFEHVFNYFGETLLPSVF